MNSITTKTIKVTVAILMLVSVSACTNTQGAPSMVDYSYVPPTKIMAPVPNPGIDEF